MLRSRAVVTPEEERDGTRARLRQIEAQHIVLENPAAGLARPGAIVILYGEESLIPRCGLDGIGLQDEGPGGEVPRSPPVVNAATADLEHGAVCNDPVEIDPLRLTGGGLREAGVNRVFSPLSTAVEENPQVNDPVLILAASALVVALGGLISEAPECNRPVWSKAYRVNDPLPRRPGVDLVGKGRSPDTLAFPECYLGEEVAHGRFQIQELEDVALIIGFRHEIPPCCASVVHA